MASEPSPATQRMAQTLGTDWQHAPKWRPTADSVRASAHGTGHRAPLLEGMSPRVNPPVGLTFELPEFRAGGTTLPPPGRDDCTASVGENPGAGGALSPGKRAWIIITLASLCWALVFSLIYAAGGW